MRLSAPVKRHKTPNNPTDVKRLVGYIKPKHTLRRLTSSHTRLVYTLYSLWSLYAADSLPLVEATLRIESSHQCRSNFIMRFIL